MHIALTKTSRRAAYGLLSAVLLAAAIAAVISHGSGWWIFTAFIVAPDLGVLLGMGSGLEKGRLHPRAIRLYNALHSLIGPALLALAAIALGPGALIGALAWAFHICFDRSIGYGMRTRDGFQRP
jgi:uncharacterized protein DUF4260